MGANNFVSRLTEADFLEFANENFRGQKFLYVTVIRDGMKDVMQVIFHNSKKWKRYNKDCKRVFFHEFLYVEALADYDQIFWSKNLVWRSFLARKFGEEYVVAYRKYMEEYFSNEESKLQEMKRDYISEINKLMKDFFVDEK